MKTKVSLLILAVLWSTPVLCADKSTNVSSASPQEDPAAMMEMWMKLNAKGEQHAAFQKSVGTWNVMEKHFMGPESFEGKGTSKMRTILDGRYLVQEYQSASPMGKFEGFGIIAYDNLRKQYVMVWIDSVSTGVSMSYGEKKGNAVTYRGSEKMPDGTLMQHRMVLKDLGPDKMTLTMHGRTAPEEEFQKRMEIIYTRVQ